MIKPGTTRHLETADLIALLSDDLNAARKRRMEAHLSNCPRCAAEADQVRQLWSAAKLPMHSSGNAEAVRNALLHQLPVRTERKPMFFLTPTRLLVGTAGIATAITVLWLTPGNPVRPLPAFAEVEAAMRNIETATWTESTVYGTPGMSDTRYYGVQVTGQPVLFYRHYSLRDHNPKGALTVMNRYGMYSPPETGPNTPEWTVVSRDKNVKGAIQEKLLFSRGALEQDRQRIRTSRDSARYGYQWHWEPWRGERVSRNGKLEIRFTSHSEVRRTDGLDGPYRTDYKVYVDPETRLISRAETRRYRGNERGTLDIRDSFRYNVPLAENVAQSLPPANTPVAINDWDTVGVGAPQVPQTEARQAGQTVGRFASALSQNDTAALSGLIDTDKFPARLALVSREELARQEQLRAFASTPQKRQLWKTFRVSRVVEVHYTSQYLYNRGDSAAFPPPPAQTAYEVVALASGTTVRGDTLTCPARISLRRVGSDLKVTDTAFYPSLPTSEAENWTTEGIRKQVQSGITKMLRAKNQAKYLDDLKKTPARPRPVAVAG